MLPCRHCSFCQIKNRCQYLSLQQYYNWLSKYNPDLYETEKYKSRDFFTNKRLLHSDICIFAFYYMTKFHDMHYDPTLDSTLVGYIDDMMLSERHHVLDLLSIDCNLHMRDY